MYFRVGLLVVFFLYFTMSFGVTQPLRQFCSCTSHLVSGPLVNSCLLRLLALSFILSKLSRGLVGH